MAHIKEVPEVISKTETCPCGSVTHFVEFINCTEEEWNRYADKQELAHWQREVVKERKENNVLITLLALSAIANGILTMIILGG